MFPSHHPFVCPWFLSYPLCFPFPSSPSSLSLLTPHPVTSLLKEAPVDENQDEEAQAGKGAILLEHKLPIDAHSSPTILFTIIPQPTANLAHALKIITTIKQVLNILGHNLRNVAQLIIKLIEVLRSAGVGVRSARLGDEVVKLHKGVRAEGRVVDGLRGVCGGELAGEVGEVGEGELARVGALADAEEDDVGVDEVVDCEEGGGLDAGLGLGVAGEFSLDLAELLLDFVEGGGVGLGLVVDGSAKHEAIQP